MPHQYKKLKCEVCEKLMRSDKLGRHMKIHKDLLTLPSDEMEEGLKQDMLESWRDRRKKRNVRKL